MDIKILRPLVEAAHGYSKFAHDNSGKVIYLPQKGAITDDVLARHLDNSQPIALHTIKDGKSHVGVFDFDDKAGDHEESSKLIRVGFVCAALDQRKVPHFVVRSGSGNGYHIWLVFENAPRVDALRDRMKSILDDANKLIKNSPFSSESFVPVSGVNEGKGMFYRTDKVFHRDVHRDKTIHYTEHHVELLPAHGHGVIAPPGARQSMPLKPAGLNQHGYVELVPADEFEVHKVRKMKPGPKSSSDKPVDVNAALDAFIKAKPGGSWKAWSIAGFNILGAFGPEEGWPLWLYYSQQVDGFESEADCQKKWRQLQKVTNKSGKEPFWAYARQGGYSGGLPEDVQLTKGDVSKEILKDIASQIELFLDRDGKAYAATDIRRFMAVDSQRFGDWLIRQAYDAGATVTSEQINAARNTARALAYDETRDVAIRVAEHDGAIYVDLCDEDDRVLVIQPGNVEIIEGDLEIPVTFRRASSAQPLRMADGTLQDIRACLNIDDEQFVVFMACVVKMFFPNTPSPIVNITGPYGSGKTSATRVMRSLVDPSSAMTSAKPKDGDDLIIRAWSNYVLALENISSLSKISDTLCGITTGMGFETRQLYTNADVVTLFVKRPVIINGIDPSKYAADLISRMVEIELSVPEERMLESQFERLLEEKAASMFTIVVHLVSKVMLMLEQVSLEECQEVRLAEFARIGEATSRVLGQEPGWFVAYMIEMQDEAQDEAASDNAVVQALQLAFSDIGGRQWRGRTQALLLELQRAVEDTKHFPHHRMPQTAAHLSKDLNMCKTVMHAKGWVLDKVGRDWFVEAPNRNDVDQSTWDAEAESLKKQREEVARIKEARGAKRRSG